MTSTAVRTSTSTSQQVAKAAIAASAAPHSPELSGDSASVGRRFGTGKSFRVLAARPGDHHAVQQLLVSVLHQPSSSEFQAQLEDPFYEPADRLVVKRVEQIVAHARVVNREMHFGDRILPTSTISDLVVLPEYRSEGCASELLCSAEHAVIAGGSKIAFLRTQSPEFFAARGWTACGRYSYSVAGARDILSRLHERQACPHDPLRTCIQPSPPIWVGAPSGRPR